MSRENVQVVRRVFDAVSRRDGEAVLALYDMDFEWDYSRVAWGDLAGPGIYRGREAMRSFYREWYDAWQDYEEELAELIDCGEKVVSVVTAFGRGRASGATAEYTTFGVWTIRDGKVLRSVWFPTRAEALEAAACGDR